MANPCPDSGFDTPSGAPENLVLVIEIGDEKLRYPYLMDPELIEDLARRNLEIHPAFRLRRRSQLDFDIRLATGEDFAFVGNFVAHTWFLAFPPTLPLLRFRWDGAAQHRCLVSWSEEKASGLGPEERHNRYLELHHRGVGPRIPLAVIHKPDPGPISDPLSECPCLPAGFEDSSTASFGVSFRNLGGQIRPWFDIFRQDLFPPGVEPELVVEARTRGFILEVVLAEGEFLPESGSKPQIRFFDAFGPIPGPPEAIEGVEIAARDRLVMAWSNPDEETVTSFEVLCRHRGREIWLDPTIYTRGIGSFGPRSG